MDIRSQAASQLFLSGGNDELCSTSVAHVCVHNSGERQVTLGFAGADVFLLHHQGCHGGCCAPQSSLDLLPESWQHLPGIYPASWTLSKMTLPKFLGCVRKWMHEATARFPRQGTKPFSLPLPAELAPQAAARWQLCPPRGWLRVRGVQSGPAAGRSADLSG